MNAVVDYGAPLLFPGIPAAIREDGTSTFSPSLTVTESGVTVTVDATLTINSARIGELTGTVNEVWRVPNINGEGRLTQDIVGTTRTSTTTLPGLSEGTRRLRVLRKLMSQDRYYGGVRCSHSSVVSEAVAVASPATPMLLGVVGGRPHRVSTTTIRAICARHR